MRKSGFESGNNLGRKTAAVASAAGIALLAGCDFSMAPKPHAETKARLEAILRPAAIKVGGRALAFYRKHPLGGAIIRDGKDGYEVGIDVEGANRGEHYDLTVDMKKTNGKLDPATTYNVSVDHTTLIDGKDEVESAEISSKEPPQYGSRDIWFGDNYTDELDPKTSESTLPENLQGRTYGDTHIDNGDSNEQIASAMVMARLSTDTVKRVFNDALSSDS
jgi:hypothetical protein